MTADHPPQDVLLRFLRNELEAEQERATDAHVSSCPACERGLAELAGGLPWPLDPVARLLGDAPLAAGPGSAGAHEPPPRLTPIPGLEVLEELGRGGMGVVFKARQTALNRVVALKVIAAGEHARAAELSRFKTEAQSIARVQHPNIVAIYEVGEGQGKPFLVLEFCPGGSLDRKLAGNPLPADQAAELAEALARAIHAAHQANVIHRDLKPANVLLAADGTPKVTDFGLARKLDEAG